MSDGLQLLHTYIHTYKAPTLAMLGIVGNLGRRAMKPPYVAALGTNRGLPLWSSSPQEREVVSYFVIQVHTPPPIVLQSVLFCSLEYLESVPSEIAEIPGTFPQAQPWRRKKSDGKITRGMASFLGSPSKPPSQMLPKTRSFPLTEPYSIFNFRIQLEMLPPEYQTSPPLFALR